MQTIKSAVVVVLLMVILYGAFVAMNGQETELPADLENLISENMMSMGPDFSLDTQSATPMTASDIAAATPPAAAPGGSSAASGSPFAFWPGAATPPAAPSADDTASTAAVEPVGETPPLLVPPPTIEPESQSVAEAPAAIGLQPPTIAQAPSSAEATDLADAEPPTAGAEGAKALAGDPWLRTLQTTVGGTEQAKDPQATLVSAEVSASDEAVKPAARSEFSVNSQSYENAKQLAMDQIDAGRLKEALRTLSVFYNSPELTADQQGDLLDLLDALASEVIYSRRHLIDLPYIVAPNETLADIAKLHEVPVELLARINGIAEINEVMPGTKLKVIRGPFRGEVDVTASELTMFLDDLYAGRFPISTGNDPEPREGVFQVVDKQENRAYYGPGGLQIDGSDPRNPYGGLWLDLGQQLSIHGSPVNPAAESKQLGCISLSPLDAQDVYTMLGRGSQVTIKR